MLYIVTHRVKGFNEDVHVHVHANVGHFADSCFAVVLSQMLSRRSTKNAFEHYMTFCFLKIWPCFVLIV